MIDQFIGRNAKFISISLLSIILLTISGYSYYKNHFEARRLIVIATGHPASESYKIMQAVAQIVNNEDFDFNIKVVSTQGSIESLKLLDKGLVHMSTSQSDLKISSKIRLVANLYEDVFHLIFHDSTSFKSIEDIHRIKVAVPSRNSGEYYSFSQLINHFGLGKNTLEQVVTDWKSATWLFENHKVDAIFKVREANHSMIKEFVVKNNAHAKAITQSEAIALNSPMYKKSYIPRGAYSGIPSNPVKNIETLGVDRILIATEKTPANIVNAISTILFTRKRELAEFSTIVGLAKIPVENSLIPWHQGLADFANKEKPSFFQKNAEFLALILSIILLMSSSTIQFLNRSKQRKLNDYNEQLLSIKVNVEQTNNLDELLKLREEHYALVNQIVGDAVQGNISSDGFEFFTFGWDSVTGLINDKEHVFKNS